MNAIDIRLGRHAVALAKQEWGADALMPIGPYLSALRPLDPASDLQRRWHVVQTQPQQEREVVRHLKGCRFDSYHPTHPSLVRVNPVRHRTVHRSMLPGYVFAGFDVAHENWEVIPSLRGVLRLLMVAMRPVPIPNDVIEHIRQKETERAGGRCVKWAPITVAIGALVRILEPVSFAGLFGRVVEIDHKGHAVGVEIDIFGRMVPVVIPPEQVEVV